MRIQEINITAITLLVHSQLDGQTLQVINHTKQLHFIGITTLSKNYQYS